jgi:nicotinate-nucleotide adenylyltransferase
MRVAFFGGTFDPIHRGHLRLASAAADAFALDRVLFAPVGNQPLKAKLPAASFADRLEMTRLALSSTTGNLQPATCSFLVSTLDAPRPDGQPNYTVDTLAALTGADSFLTMRKWRSPDRLLALAEWIVVSRPEFPLAQAQLAQLALAPGQLARVHLLATVQEDVSATELRRRLQAGDPCPGLLSPAVAAYIQAHHLYR